MFPQLYAYSIAWLSQYGNTMDILHATGTCEATSEAEAVGIALGLAEGQLKTCKGRESGMFRLMSRNLILINENQIANMYHKQLNASL